MPHFYDTCVGSIEGLCLPLLAWDVLRRENIDTINQLRVKADQLEQLDGIGSRMAHIIRQELARATALEEQMSYGEQLDAWTA